MINIFHKYLGTDRKINRGDFQDLHTVDTTELEEFIAQNKRIGIVIAASDSSDDDKEIADYVCGDSVADEVFQTVINAIYATIGGTINVLPGTYTFNRCVEIKGDIKLLFTPGAVIKLANQVSSPITADYHMEDTTVTVEDGTKFLIGQDVGITVNSSTGYIHGYQRRVTNIQGNILTVAAVDDYIDEGTCEVANGARVLTHHSMFRTATIENVLIDGGEFDGNKANIPSFLVNKDSAQNFLLAGAGDDKVVATKNCFVHDFNFQGIHPVGTTAKSNFTIENCKVTDCGFSGICLDSCYGQIFVTNCTCEDNGSFGLQSIVTLNVQIIGGYFINNSLGGIYCGHFEYATRNQVIIGATITQSSITNKIGIALNGNMENAVVSDCYIYNCNVGVDISSAKNCYVHGNLIKACNNGVLEHSGTADRNVIGQNYYRECSSDSIKHGSHSFLAALLDKDGNTPSTAYIIDTPETWTYQLVDGTSRTNQTIKTTMKVMTDYGSYLSTLSFRESFTVYPDWNCYALHVQASGWILVVRHGDAIGIDGYNDVPPVVGQEYDIEINITGTAMYVKIDGVERLSATNGDIAAGNVALHNYKCKVSYEGEGTYGIEIT